MITGTDDDSAPTFSPDGTKIAFLRKATVNGSLGQEIVVASADGSNQIVVSRQPAARSSTQLSGRRIRGRCSPAWRTSQRS